jgi:hypothetical protein
MAAVTNSQYVFICCSQIGYLYLTNQQRLEELMAKLGFSNDNSSLLAGFGLPQIDTSIRPSL